MIEEPDARVVLVLLEGHWCGAGAGDRGVSAPVSLVFFPRVKAFPDLGDACPRGRRHARRGGIIHGSDDIKHSPANELVTPSRPLRYSPSSTPTTRLSSESSWREGGEGRGEVSHQTGEGTRFRSARRGGARTSSTRRKWSTTDRSTRGCTTTSSYCPRGLTTSTLAAIVVECLSPVGNGYADLDASIGKKKVGSGRGRENAGADCVRGTVRSAVHTRAEHRTISHSPRGHTR